MKRFVFLLWFILTPVAIISQPSPAAAAACGSSNCHVVVNSLDISNADGDAAQAGWEEQYSIVVDYSTGGFVYQGMWLASKSDIGDYVEVGFIHHETCGPAQYCFVHAHHVNGVQTSYQVLSKSPSGAHFCHKYRLQYNPTYGGIGTYFGNVKLGSTYSQQRASGLISIGNELTNNSSTVHITYWGYSVPSSQYAFKYRTSSGFWTTWGSAQAPIIDWPYHLEWVTYAIRMRTWGP